MKRISGIFCYNRVLLNGRWHMPAVSCLTSYAESRLLRDDEWVDVIECRSGKSMVIRELLSESIPTDFPNELTKLEESVDDPSLSREDRRCVSISHHVAYIITECDMSGIKMPCFFSTEHHDLSAFCATAILSHYQIRDLPEVMHASESLSAGGLRSNSLVDRAPVGNIRPPLGIWYPVSIEGRSGVFPGVFRIREWQSSSIASIDGFVAATPSDVNEGDRLFRNYEGHFCEIGAVDKLSSVNLMR